MNNNEIYNKCVRINYIEGTGSSSKHRDNGHRWYKPPLAKFLEGETPIDFLELPSKLRHKENI